MGACGTIRQTAWPTAMSLLGHPTGTGCPTMMTMRHPQCTTMAAGVLHHEALVAAGAHPHGTALNQRLLATRGRR